MPEPEQNDVNSVQPVTEQSVEQSVAQAEGVPVESLTTQVPFNEDPKIQDYIKRQVEKATEPLTLQNQQYQQALMAQQAQQQPQGGQQEQINAYLASKGIDPEYATPSQMTQVFIEIQREAMNNMQNQFQEQKIMSQYPDMNNVLGGSNPITGQIMPSSALTNYIQRHPEQLQAVQSNLATAQGKALVYQTIVNDPEYRKTQLNDVTIPAETKQAQAMINNANSMASISNAGTPGAMDKTAALTAMTPEQFQAHKDAIIARG